MTHGARDAHPPRGAGSSWSYTEEGGSLRGAWLCEGLLRRKTNVMWNKWTPSKEVNAVDKA